MMLRDMAQFDRTHAQTLERIWFLGDVHGHFTHIAQALRHSSEPPRWLVFLGEHFVNDLRIVANGDRA